MNYSLQKGQLDQEPLLSKIDTGTLLEVLAEVTSAGESEWRCTLPPPKTVQKPLKPVRKPLTYTRQLADPRWKSKRNLILARDGFSCVNCGVPTNLHVHHIKYTGYAWEAPDDDLLTLCATCHKKVHAGVIEIIVQNYPLDGKIIYPIEGTCPPEFDLYAAGATDDDIPYLSINRYGNRCVNSGDYFLVDIRAWGYE